MSVEHWQKLTITPPSVLNATIVELHHAAQLVAAVGNSLLTKKDDDSQSSLSWDGVQKALIGQQITLDQKVYPILKYDDLSVHILSEQEEVLHSFSLLDHNKTQALDWLNQVLKELGHQGKAIDYPNHYELPSSPLHRGAVFASGSMYRQELARYRSNTQIVLQSIAATEALSDVKVWPHHFDLASVITLEVDDQGNPTRTIGLGLAIPDATSHTLYYYVSHWLKEGRPNYRSLPALPGNALWLSKGFKGVILPVSGLVKLKSKEAQSALLEAFFREAIVATRHFF
jgi:hypothetical protein